MKELVIPYGVHSDGNPEEFIRFWICDGSDHVSLKIGGFSDNSNESELWGAILADIAWHAINGMQQDDPSRGSKEEMLAQIEYGFGQRLKDKRNLSGQLGGGH
ncbi:MAG: DUF5076 domain-containing protein [Pseudomonadota bacterium]